MASYTIEEYVGALYPNLSTLLPGFSPAIAINGVMSLYWSYIFPDNTSPSPNPGNPTDPNYLVETALTERQKYMVALRVAIQLLPIINGWLTSPQVLEAQAGPALAKFQDLSKLLRVVLPLWQTDLNNTEAAEGIFFNLLPSVPGYLLALSPNYPVLGETISDVPVSIVQSGVVVFDGEYLPIDEGI